MTLPIRTIERLGKHHGLDCFRVSVNDQIFSGDTEHQAIAEATIWILEQFHTVTINTTPPLEPTP
jgi:hypothetical protein